MAIQLSSISKRRDNVFTVTVTDTGDQIGTDEKDAPVYRTYSVPYNTSNSTDHLKLEIEAEIAAKKKQELDATAVETDIKTAVESIDTSKIAAEEG